MRTFTIEEITQATGGKLLSGNPKDEITKIATDSRQAEEGDLFFALIGLVNDGHKYLGDVMKNGCRSLIVSDESKVPGDGDTINVVLVDDTTKALQRLAKYYLSTMPLKKKIAVTGSVGKTSTRDMLFAIAETKYKAARSIKNFNNGFGLPLSIMDFPPDTEVAVLEMGMDDFGEIETLADLVRPDVALITEIGISHIEKLGSRQGILQAKMEVTTFFDENSVLIVNSDCDLLKPGHTAGNYHLLTVGTEKKDDFVVSDVCDFGDKGIKYRLDRKDKHYEIGLFLPGAHNAINATLAIAAGELLGVDVETAVEGLKNAALTEKRLHIIEEGGVKIIDDTYNACPASMKSAVNTLMASGGNRKVAILGDMFELGAESENAHFEVGVYAAEKQVDLLIAVGNDARQYAEGAKKSMDPQKILCFEKKEDLIEKLSELIETGDVILVKASRSMFMEKIVNAILEMKEKHE